MACYDKTKQTTIKSYFIEEKQTDGRDKKVFLSKKTIENKETFGKEIAVWLFIDSFNDVLNIEKIELEHFRKEIRANEENDIPCKNIYKNMMDLIEEEMENPNFRRTIINVLIRKQERTDTLIKLENKNFIRIKLFKRIRNFLFDICSIEDAKSDLIEMANKVNILIRAQEVIEQSLEFRLSILCFLKNCLLLSKSIKNSIDERIFFKSSHEKRLLLNKDKNKKIYEDINKTINNLKNINKEEGAFYVKKQFSKEKKHEERKKYSKELEKLKKEKQRIDENKKNILKKLSEIKETRVCFLGKDEKSAKTWLINKGGFKKITEKNGIWFS